MAILILSSQADAHATQIAWGLRAAGHRVKVWEGLGWQHERRASIASGSRKGVWFGDHKLGPGDTVWVRRPELASRHPNLNAIEEKFSRAEYSAFQSTLLVHVEYTGAFCVNKWSSATRIENKSIQLALAEQCGLAVPCTVMSNSREAVDGFLQTVTGDAVHKSFTPHMWVDRTSRRAWACETSLFDRKGSYPSETFAYAPAIYQERIEKQYDARITMIGRDFHAFIIDAENVLDWRLHLAGRKGAIRRVDLPPAVENGLARFADYADIVFGCFDMTIDRDGKWWFLEVNQSGQFLWIDDLCHEHGLYVPMLRFLSAREPQPRQPSEHTFPTYNQCKREFKFEPHLEPLAGLPYVTVAGEDQALRR